MKIIVKSYVDMDDKTMANLIALEFAKNGYTDKCIENGREIKFEKIKT